MCNQEKQRTVMNISPDVLDAEASRGLLCWQGPDREEPVSQEHGGCVVIVEGSVSQVGARVGGAEERGEGRRYAEAGAWGLCKGQSDKRFYSKGDSLCGK